jgi:hypothetical protein
MLVVVCVGSRLYLNQSVLVVGLFAYLSCEGTYNTFFTIGFHARTRVCWIVVVLCVSLLLFLITFVVFKMFVYSFGRLCSLIYVHSVLYSLYFSF